jgi:hypothetical protein
MNPNFLTQEDTSFKTPSRSPLQKHHRTPKRHPPTRSENTHLSPVLKSTSQALRESEKKELDET